MPSTTINPTRQELNRLKNRLRTSIRGHKLLKDKRDELMKQFMDVVRENRALRKRVEEGLSAGPRGFSPWPPPSCPRRCWSSPCSTPSRAWSWT